MGGENKKFALKRERNGIKYEKKYKDFSSNNYIYGYYSN